MGAENFVNTTVGGKRGARRSRVLLSARLETEGGEFFARLRDLSRLGALIECSGDPVVGSAVTFVRGAIRVPAHVAWAAGGRVGLQFDFPVDEAELLVQLKHKSNSEGRPRLDRPIVHGMSPSDRRLAKAWGAAVGLSLPDSER